MKKSIFLFATLSFLAVQGLFAQFTISCNYREICKWNPNTKDFEDCYKYEENSLFKFNESGTMVKHTTEDMKSAYYIADQTKDEETGVWRISVESDVGNNYTYFLDLDHNEVRVVVGDNDEFKLVRFYIKRVWAN